MRSSTVLWNPSIIVIIEGDVHFRVTYSYVRFIHQQDGI